MKKYIPLIFVLFFLLTLLSIVLYPTATPIVGIIVLLLTIAISTYTITKKHAGTEHARAKILKEVGVMVLTLILLLFLGGISAMLANAQMDMRWGEVAGLISAIAASFAVGHFVRMGMGRFAG